MSYIDIEIPLLNGDIEVRAEYQVYGEFLKETLTDPAEAPEVELQDLIRNVDGEEVSLRDMLTGDEWSEIRSLVEQYLEEGE